MRDTCKFINEMVCFLIIIAIFTLLIGHGLDVLNRMSLILNQLQYVDLINKDLYVSNLIKGLNKTIRNNYEFR